ncbi:MAG: molybdopterin-dependent oxidoreductase [Deltaproteobacteria bacterium]|nr:molybdopterin-dependent oxidoreductase [Deltaproteobacteria bacterium]
MTDRRLFLKHLIDCAAGFLAGSFYWLSKPETSWGAVRRLLPKGTRLETLVNENPAGLDTRELDLQPLDRFGTMGLSDQATDLANWRLVCTGEVRREFRLSYDELRNLPAIEKQVLLICPGFFANYGRWKGISLIDLGKKAGIKKDVDQVTISGPAGPYEKSGRFPLKDIKSEKVFLAYQVNGETLPVKHGFPLRLVAEGYYGYEWIKYVDAVRFERIGNT